jgi:hypothetical protein
VRPLAARHHPDVFESHPPDNGLTGRATVVGSCGGMVPHIKGETIVPMVVDILEGKPYLVSHRCRLTLERYPLPGDVVEVVVDPDRPLHIWADWDKLPTIDERLAAGDQAFTDPEAVKARIDAANQELVESGYALATEELAPEQAASVKTMRDFVQRTMLPTPPPSAPAAAPSDRATARVVADSVNGAGPGDDGDGVAVWRFGELLLSVSVPGKPRYGARYRGLVRTLKDLSGDLPVEFHESNPAKVKIDWHQVPNLFQRALKELHEDVAEAQARLDALPQQRETFLANAVADPAVRAQMEAVMKQAGAPQAADLERLNALHQSGVLDDEEFAAETRRLFGQA